MTTGLSARASRLSVFVLVLFSVLISEKSVCGQTSTATLTGTIRDPSGAILPGVTVVITSSSRNTSQSTTSNEAGSYVFAAILPGAYSLTAELNMHFDYIQTDHQIALRDLLR